jgi:hypothetical protein
MAEDILSTIDKMLSDFFPRFSDKLSEFLGGIDTPGTYIMWIVIGLVLVPFYVKSVYNQFKNPAEYYMISFEKTIIMGAIFFAAWFIFGVVNFFRFVG